MEISRNQLDIFLKSKLLSLIFLISFLTAKGQEVENKGKNNIFFELYGNTETILSLNYERVFYRTPNEFIDFSFRTGFGCHSSGIDSSYRFSFVAEVNSIIGRKIHFLDMGIGITPHFSTSNLKSTLIPETERAKQFYHSTFRIGYRLRVGDVLFIRASEILTFRPKTPKSNTFIFRNSIGLTMGFIF